MRATNSIFDAFNSAGDWKLTEGNTNDNNTTAEIINTNLEITINPITEYRTKIAVRSEHVSHTNPIF